MLSIKLHEATKQFEISNKLAMFFLEKKMVPVKSHSSVINMDQLEMLREFSKDKKEKVKFKDIWNEFKALEDAKKKKKKERERARARGEAPPENVEPQKEEPRKPEPPKEEPKKEELKTEPEKERVEKRVAKKPEPRKEKQKPETKPETSRQPKSEPSREPKREPKPEPRREPKSEPRREPKREAKPESKPESKPEPRREPKHDRKEPAPHRHPEKKKEVSQEKQQKPQKPHKPKHDKHPQPKPQPGAPKPAEADKQKPQPARKKEKRRDDRRGDQRGDRRQRPDNKNKRHSEHGRGRQAPPPPKPEPPKPKPKKVLVLPDLVQTSNFVNLKELSEKLNIKLKDIEEKFRELKSDKEFMTFQILDSEEIKEICAAFGVEVDIVSYEDDLHLNHIEKSKAELTSRAPVVTVMGHVDHGKTTLLDTLRDSRVAAREAGGITQSIGAYRLTTDNHDTVFIDTPGHEAFTNIRARGAKVTDIVVLVVAANDGVKPQTIEAINHARAAEVPMVVAINKIDLDGASPDRVKQELTKHNIVVEDWGGDVVSVEISAKFNKNLDSLLEMLSLVSEMQELTAYKDIPARGTIVESRLDPKLGPVATVLLQHGKLKRGDFFICGNSTGKVKSVFDDQGKVLKDAQVPQPIEIMGFEVVPEAGELFQVTEDSDKARKVVESRKIKVKEANQDEAMADKKMSLQSLFQRLQDDQIKEFPIIMKTDNFSSGEVLESILQKHDHEKLKINIVHQSIGNISESDIQLASTSGSIIIGFNVKAPQKLMPLAKRENVEIKLYNVIYHLIEDIDKAIKGEIAPEYIESKIGAVEVLQLFKISKIGIIAGCLVKEGKITNKSKLKVLRQNDLVFEGDIETLRRVKNDASEVNAGTECGIKIKNFNDVEVGDILEVYETSIKEVK